MCEVLPGTRENKNVSEMAFSLFEFSNTIMAFQISGRKEDYVWAGAPKQWLESSNWDKVEWLFLALQRAQEAIHALLIATEFSGTAWLFINLKTLGLYRWRLLSTTASSEC